MRGWKKTACNIGFLLVLFALTFYLLLKDHELSGILASLRSASPLWLLAGVGLVVIFVCSESVIIYYLIGRMDCSHPKMGSCIKYSFVGFFYSCITPSASGGQPMQAYYMKRDGIPVSISSLVLMVVTILYKLVLVVIGLFVLLAAPELLHGELRGTKFFLYLGLGLNLLFISGMMILVCAPNLVRWLGLIILNLAERIKLLNHLKIWRQVGTEAGEPPVRVRRRKLEEAMERYRNGALVLRAHKGAIFNSFLITLFQRVCLFAVTWLVYRSLGLDGVTLWKIVILQAVISIDVDMLPLPGGIGASESLFLKIFAPIFGKKLVMPGMLLSRGINYYVLILISAAVSVYAHLTVTCKKQKMK